MARTKRPQVAFEPDPLVLFGARLRELRRRRGYSQEELGALAGLDSTFISACENARRNPSLLTMWRLAMALDVDLGELVRR